MVAALQVHRSVLIDDEDLNRLTGVIVGCAIEVHRVLGPGLLESVYRRCLCFELATRKLKVSSEQVLPIVYKDIPLRDNFRVDLLVEDRVIVEVKAVECLAAVHSAQLLTYLKLSGHAAGMLINFNVPKLVDGVRRLVNPRAGLASRGR